MLSKYNTYSNTYITLKVNQMDIQFDEVDLSLIEDDLTLTVIEEILDIALGN